MQAYRRLFARAPPGARRKLSCSNLGQKYRCSRVFVRSFSGESVSLPCNEKYTPVDRLVADSHVKGEDAYRTLHDRSINDNDAFWSKVAREQVEWSKPFTQVRQGEFEDGTVSWFLGGKLNASYNCLDRHAATNPDDIAILWEGNEPGEVRKITFKEALGEVCRIANAMTASGIKKGDRVGIYMPMVPEATFAMLACARIGAPHIVVFAGFSATALSERLVDAGCTALFTADEGVRGTKVIPLKNVADDALKLAPKVQSVFVLRRTGGNVVMVEGRDQWLHEATANQRAYAPCAEMDAEDILFLLHTSGSTGKPKGVAHTTGGYLVYTSYTQKLVFDYKPGSIHGCMADIGWITGHSYIVYGPLVNGATTFMFEGLPTYPGPDRYWDMVARHKIDIFYTAPTALRALMRSGDTPVTKHDLSSLRVLGTVGEPINPEAWRWYYNVVGKKQCAIVDTYWQTETGGVLASSLPGSTIMKPGACATPFPGVDMAIIDGEGKEVEGNNVTGMLAVRKPWPGMARTIFGDHARFEQAYFKIFPGFYYTGDRAIRDGDGHIWVTGRADDVMNVSGHRIGSAEVEGALVEHKFISEAAVISIPHDIKGEGIVAFVTSIEGVHETASLVLELNELVKEHVGAFAKPDMIVVTDALPKVQSGKIMRRLLRKIAAMEVDQLGDTSTLVDPTVVDTLVSKVRAKKS